MAFRKTAVGGMLASKVYANLHIVTVCGRNDGFASEKLCENMRSALADETLCRIFAVF